LGRIIGGLTGGELFFSAGVGAIADGDFTVEGEPPAGSCLDVIASVAAS